ncbi:CHAT domain-containing protein [Embleya sp. NPDC050493]|uniref:CHAT domain-containing tetratricopeptide repeat protein n=1 Tax=Embleya sp. NPDC050493 TaxID=3363989 RepID=UPI00378F3CF0
MPRSESGGDRGERDLARALLSAMSVRHAEGLLTRAAGRFDPDVLLRELDSLCVGLKAAGRPEEAALAEFHKGTVEGLHAALTYAFERITTMARRGDGPRPSGYREPSADPREQLERESRELSELGALDAALAVLRRADAMPPSGPDAVPRIAALRMHLAGALRSAGRAQEALALLDKVAFGPGTAIASGDDALVMQLQTNRHFLRGLLCDDNAAYEQARFSFGQAIEAARACGDSEAEYQARTALAASYQKAGLIRQSVREARRALSHVEVNGGRLVGALNNLGHAYGGAGEPKAARSCYERALRLLEEEGSEGLSAVHALIGIGDLACDAGNEHEAAEAYFQALVKSMSAVTYVMEEGMSLVVTRAERMGAAGDLLLTTADAFRDTRPDLFASGTSRLLFGLAHASRHEQAGRHADAVAILRELTAQGSQQSPSVQMGLLATERLARTLMRWTEHATARQDAFDGLWEARERLVRVPSERRSTQDWPARVALHRGVYESLLDLLLDHGDELRLPAGTAESPLELAFDVHEEYKTWTGGTGRESPVPARFHALRGYLRNHPDAAECAFVSYFCGHQVVTIFTYVPATDRLTAVRTPLTEQTLRRAAERLRRAFDGDPEAFPPQAPLPARRPWKRSLAFFEELAEGLLAFLPHVAGRQLLCVAACGPLHNLPLHALPLPGEDRPLAERHAVVQVTSATILLRLADLPPAKGSSTVYVAGTADRDDPEPGRLEHDAELVTSCGRSVVGDTGIRATPDVVAIGLRGASIAHLAGHGWFDPTEPLDSGLLFSYDGQRPARHPHTVDVQTRLDHVLTARRLAREGLRLDLLTLRACSTARWDAQSTGYLEGVVQALLHSGVRTVVATLWDVDDTSSRRLFADFYRLLLCDDPATPGQPPWRALWQAQRAMMRQPGGHWETHPYHWAALALFGVWRHT